MPYTPNKYKYVCEAPIQNAVQLEYACFNWDWPSERGGLGKYGHFRQIAALQFPTLEWNPWLEMQMRSLCNEDYAIRSGDTVRRFVTWTGCAAAAKTHGAAFYAFLWFMIDPFNSIVDLTSTTKDMVSKRIWPEIQKFYQICYNPISECRYRFGHMVDSEKIIQAQKGDRKHSIAAIAVRDGETMKAVENLKGRHAERILMVIDEAKKTPEAIYRTTSNKLKACRDFTLLVIDNAGSKLDAHGRCCEPLKGWNSVNIDSESWPTKGVPEWEIGPGICVHFDGFKSPNVKAGKTLWPYLYTWENYLHATKGQGGESLDWWSQDRGFWPADGKAYVVITEQMVDKYDGSGQHTFYSKTVPVACLDAAFGGDDCILQFGLLGDLSSGDQAIQLTEFIEIQGDTKSADELDYQIARRFIKECQARNVPPQYAAVLSTGIGRGVAAIVATEWSGDIIKIEEGGAASEGPASKTDSREAKDVYDRRITELWYSVREFLMSGQLKGLYREAIIEFAARNYEEQHRKVILETKDECKARLGHSPDHADAIAGIVEVCKQHGLSAGGPQPISQSWNALKKKADAESMENSYTEPDEQAYYEAVNEL